MIIDDQYQDVYTHMLVIQIVLEFLILNVDHFYIIYFIFYFFQLIRNRS
jgi:hypothetical protein